MELMDLDEQAKQLMLSTEEEFKKFYFVENLIPKMSSAILGMKSRRVGKVLPQRISSLCGEIL